MSRRMFGVLSVLFLSSVGSAFADFTQAIPSATYDTQFSASTLVFHAQTYQGGTGTQYKLTAPGGLASPAQGYYNGFPNGTPKSFTLTYDPGTGTAVFNYAGVTSTSLNAAPGGFNAIGIQLRADANGSYTGMQVALTNLVINNQSYSAPPTDSGSGYLDYSTIFGSAFTTPFTMTGDVAMTWAGAGPGPNSRIEANFDFANVTDTPEPGFYGALSLGLAGLFFVRRRVRRA